MDVYGYDNCLKSKVIRDKGRNTCLKNHGVDNIFKNAQYIKDCIKQKYGVESVTQVKEIHEKQQSYSGSHKTVVLPSGKIINKQGYEPQFIEHVFKNNLLTEDEINYHPNGITYIRPSDGKSHIYFPDFYIPKYNLIVEIKSSWTEKIDQNLLLKEQACKQQGYNYLRIVNSNFDIFDKYLQEINHG
jgi:hypothetical protein